LIGNESAGRIETARMSVTIRFAEPRDAAGIQSIYAPYCESSSVSFETVAPTVAQMAERIERVLAQYPWLVCEVGGQLAGYAYATRHSERAAYGWSVDVAIYTSPEFRRRGVARALYTSLFALLRAQGYYKAYAGIVVPNVESVRLHEAVGFKPMAVFPGVGYKLGRWRDVGWWQLDLQPESPEPAPPRTVGELINTEVARAALAEGERLVRVTLEG
jgi:L-amino acid N-acyltransferase YncA